VYQKRLRLAYLVLCVGLLIIAARLFYLQVCRVTDIDPSYRLMPRPSWRTIPAPRGSITDRNGVVLAVDRPVLNLAVPYDILRGAGSAAEKGGQGAGIETWLAEACRVAGRDPAEVRETRRRIIERVERIRRNVLERARRTGRRIRKIREETIAHTLMEDIPFELAARIEAAPERFPGVVIRSSLKRTYPLKSLAVQALGYVVTARYDDPLEPRPIRGDPTIEPGDRIGELGAERAFDRWLRGMPGYCKRGRDEKTGEITREVIFPAHPGRSVTLTLDAEAQGRAEEALGERQGGVVVLDCRNGEILVLASTPTYDNNDLAAAFRAAREDQRSGLFLSKAMRASVASGSVIKPIVALAAAEKGAVTPGTTFVCEGAMRFGGRLWRCAGHHGRIEMVGAVEHSCNIWFYNAGLKAGPGAIVAMARSLGWGRKTGIDLPWEWPGFLPNPGVGWFPGNTLNLSIGQGNIHVTPLQVAVSMAAIANGGRVLRPHVLQGVRPPPEGYVAPESFVVREVALPPEALRAVREGMRRVPISGTARSEPFGPRLAALRVAAKTGTAETGNPQVNHAWIAGYVPWNAPRYAFAVVVHRTPGHGAEVAGPVAAAALEALMRDE